MRRQIMLIGICLALHGCDTPNESRQSRPKAQPADVTAGRSCLALAEGAVESELRGLAKSAASKNAFMTALVQKRPDLASHFALVRKSDSLFKKDITPEQPRIVATDGSIFVAAHDNIGTAAPAVLEVIAPSDDGKKFDFFLIDMSKAGAERVAKDPQVCASCHHGRPIWAAYNLWPGSYAGFDDTFTIPKRDGDSPDKAAFDGFCVQSAQKSIYAPFFAGAASADDCAARLGSGNADLSDTANELVMKVLVKSAKTAAGWSKKRYAWLAAAMSCPETGAVVNAVTGRTAAQWLEGAHATQQSIEEEFAARLDDFTALNALTEGERQAVRDESLRFVKMNWQAAAAIDALVESSALAGFEPGFIASSGKPAAKTRSFATPRDAVVSLRDILSSEDVELAALISKKGPDICAELLSLAGNPAESGGDAETLVGSCK